MFVNKFGTMHKPLRLQLTTVSLFFLILISTTWIYWDGLLGSRLLDDTANLQSLELINKRSDKFTEIVRFTTEGVASRLGRPVSLLSFALQAHHWPLQLWNFKYVNLMIHLVNGCLIFWLLLYITRIMALPERRALLLTLLTTSLWLLHPFQVSTVLYIVQRMVELSAFFTLAALLIYVRSRQQLAQGLITHRAFWIWISLGIGLGGILATLSKENGVLLVLYVLVLEATVLRTLPKPRYRYWQAWNRVFLYLPLLALASYFIWNFQSQLNVYDIRHFSMGERLLTETRILSDYLFKILIPLPHTYGLFHDDYVVSRNLLEPITTVCAVSFVSLVFIAALLWRKKYPVFALAVLWFLAGHVLESSFIGLMLYFEHRNYLAMLGILFAVIYGALWMFDQFKDAFLRKVSILFSALYLLLFSVVTGIETDLWGKPLIQATIWAEQQPHSRMVQSHAASLFLVARYDKKALEYYQYMVKAFPEDSGPYAIWLGASCYNSKIPLPDIEKVIHRFRTSKGDIATINGLELVVRLQGSGKCARLSSETLDIFLKTLIENSVFIRAYRNELYHLYALFYQHEKRYDDAIRMADESLSLSSNIPLRLNRMIWLQLVGRDREVLDDIVKLRAQLNPIEKTLYLEDLNIGEKLIQKKLDIQAEQNNNSSSK
jgi:hypothetical protein